jgi:hypothetical protein
VVRAALFQPETSVKNISKNQEAFNVVSLISSVVLYPVMPIGPEMIKAQAVSVWINDFQ